MFESYFYLLFSDVCNLHLYRKSESISTEIHSDFLFDFLCHGTFKPQWPQDCKVNTKLPFSRWIEKFYKFFENSHNTPQDNAWRKLFPQNFTLVGSHYLYMTNRGIFRAESISKMEWTKNSERPLIIFVIKFHCRCFTVL